MPFSITTANGVVITVYDVHPVAELFPMIAEGEDYEKLKADIKARGVDQPVVFWRDPVRGATCSLTGATGSRCPANSTAASKALS